MRIALYQGTSFISRAIRWQTRSVYSHAAFLLEDGSVIEAWQPCVRRVMPKLEDRRLQFGDTNSELRTPNSYLSALSEQHTPGTVVDIFDFVDPLTLEEEAKLEDFARQDLGTPYDYLGITRFVTRYGGGDDKKLFCSEQVFNRCAQIGRRLLERCEGWEIPPRDIARSPLLKKSFSLTTS